MDNEEANGQASREEPCPRRLPTLVYRGKRYTVDFRLKELRYVEGHERIEFHPFSEIVDRKLLAGLRRLKKQCGEGRTWTT